jgi:hypothetical protein
MQKKSKNYLASYQRPTEGEKEKKDDGICQNLSAA